MSTGPCKECGKRAVGCHGSCPEYQRYYKGNREENARRRKQIDTQMNFVEERRSVYKYAVRKDRMKHR